MNKITLCITCAFTRNLENNQDVMVMSINSDKFETRCHNCNKKIGHSKHLNKLIGVYHEKRHEESWMPHKNDNLKKRFDTFRKNKYNGDTLNCFVMTIKKQKYRERTIRDSFNKLVDSKDVEIFDKKKLISELLELSRPRLPKAT